jgi:transcriptional regulator with XRE-family HTH domain
MDKSGALEMPESPNDPVENTRAGRPRLDPRAFEAASRIRQARIYRGLRQTHIAMHLGVPKQRARFWEAQFGRPAEESYLQRLADFLDVPAEWISHGIGDPFSLDVLTAISQDPLPCNDLKKIALERLGDRAKARRKEVGLSRETVGLAIGTNHRNLVAWERCLPKTPNRLEALWESALLVPTGWLRDETLLVASALNTQLIACLQPCDTVAAEIRAVSRWLSRNNKLRRTFDYEKLSSSEQRACEMFAIRYGIYGEEKSTLQSIGDVFGVTRERVRQITTHMSERATGMQVATPCLEQLAATISEMTPCTHLRDKYTLSCVTALHHVIPTTFGKRQLQIEVIALAAKRHVHKST